MMDAENAPRRPDRPDEEDENPTGEVEEALESLADTPEDVTAIELSDAAVSPEDADEVKQEVEEERPDRPLESGADMTVEESAQVISQLQEGNRNLHDKLLRARADFENLKRRHEREKAEQIQTARKVIFRDLLDIMDNFERALDAAQEQDTPFIVGVEMIYRQFKEFLTQNQVMEIQAKGHEFNPHLHEALAQQPTADLPENTILEVFQKGYTYRGKLLRAAQVKVAIKLEQPDAADPDASNAVDVPTDEN